MYTYNTDVQHVHVYTCTNLHVFTCVLNAHVQVHVHKGQISIHTTHSPLY